ncbi:MAG TPA: hypothetical protein VGO92_09295, partial [Acidimicrobiales bacterium]|nr:hypothetical protein [Acidimicrobiales bacterium]
MIRRLVALMVVLGLVVGGAAPALAAKKKKPTPEETAKQQRKDEIKKQIAGLREQVAEASAAESELLGRLDDVQ